MRITQGVTLMRTREGKVVDLAVVEHDTCESDDWSEPAGAVVPEGDAVPDGSFVAEIGEGSAD
jgi:hypothetical protein